MSKEEERRQTCVNTGVSSIKIRFSGSV